MGSALTRCREVVKFFVVAFVGVRLVSGQRSRGAQVVGLGRLVDLCGPIVLAPDTILRVDGFKSLIIVCAASEEGDNVEFYAPPLFIAKGKRARAC